MATIRVGTYNIGHFTEGRSVKAGGSQTRKPIYREAIMAMKCDILGIEENNPEYNYRHPEVSSYSQVYSMYDYYSTDDREGANCNAILSKYPFHNERAIRFGKGGDHRRYFEADIDVDGTMIHFMVMHLDWRSRKNRVLQISEAIEHAKEYENVIAVGDVNPQPLKRNPHVYEEDTQMWLDAGFESANPGIKGVFFSYIDARFPDCLDVPFDNIFVRGNLKITDVGQIVRPYMDDHTPIWAEVEILG